ncbi:hypothetical protein BKA70DRAFT_1462638 [Coprinopsis sp. MPI-PUGE-AT-0042]|nr:hypothetical protein BKA70DRAFT_1462638 [Coprinopsis sp. MPI-PUGE-AT-0042]
MAIKYYLRPVNMLRYDSIIATLDNSSYQGYINGSLLVLGTAFLEGVLWIALPTLEEADRPMLKIPKSFAELQALNILLKKYRDIYPYRIVVCYVVTYLYLPAFSLPGSMYLSILGGAVWGVPRALPLACCCVCVATGATLCYLISAVLGPALLVIPRWRALMDKWGDKIQANKENMISFLIVLRIAPTALGIVGVSVIHTTIGGGLDEMTSPADFHLISWRNFFGLAAIVVGVMIPVGLRYWFRREVAIAEEVPEEGEQVDEDAEDTVIAVGPPPAHKKFSRNRPLLQQDGTLAGYSSDEDDDGDVILEAGPAIDDGKAPKPDAPLIVLDPSPSSVISLHSIRQTRVSISLQHSSTLYIQDYSSHSLHSTFTHLQHIVAPSAN